MSPSSSPKPNFEIGLTQVVAIVATLIFTVGGYITTQTNTLSVKIDKTNENVSEHNEKLSATIATQDEVLKRLDHIDIQLGNIEKGLHGQWQPLTPGFHYTTPTTTAARSNGI